MGRMCSKVEREGGGDVFRTGSEGWSGDGRLREEGVLHGQLVRNLQPYSRLAVFPTDGLNR